MPAMTIEGRKYVAKPQVSAAAFCGYSKILI